MNFLAHAALSFGDEGLLTGNMIADEIKGKAALEAYPEDIRKGIRLHRAIDSYTDAHPATSRAKVWFREAYRLYSGAVVDTIFDHFLANDPKFFLSEAALFDFTQKTYAQLDSHSAYFPPHFTRFFPYMKEQNWLYNYRTVIGTKQSLQGLHRRAQQMPAPDAAYDIFIINYYALAQCYYELMEGLLPFVRNPALWS